ncbi:MAG: glycosyltransferase family 39 protein [Nitrososphaeraceae archaeon]
MKKLTTSDAHMGSAIIGVRLRMRRLMHKRDFVILICSVALLFVGAQFLFEGSNRWVYWLYDDTEHLSVAYNLFHGEGLTRDFIDLIGASSTESNTPHLMNYDQISNSLRSKAPLHLVLLGGWLFITGANYTNWFFWGSIFNFVLAAMSIVLFYFFAKRHFGITIAAYAAPILALMPPLVWYSVRIRPDLLAFIFLIMTFYFAAKRITYQNIILAGIFCGMTHLAHPIGLMPVSALVIYLLLFKRKFKATIVLFGTWALVILPWMIRNYMVFGDATQGLGFPLPRGVSTAIGLISPSAPSLNSADVGTVAGIPLSQTMMGMLDEFTHLYGMQFFMGFMACSIIVYLSFPAIKRAVSSSYTKIVLILSVVIYVLAIMLVDSLNNLTVQFVVFFLIPLIVYIGIRFFSRHKDIFTTEGKDIYTMLAILAIISFVPYLMFAQTTGRVVPEVRIIIFSLFMLIPLAIIGIEKLIRVVVHTFHIGSSSIWKKTVSISMISTLVLFSAIQISAGIPSLNAFQNRFAESEQMIDLHRWITENIPEDAKVASNLPHAILLRTGHEAVIFATSEIDNTAYVRWIVTKFDIDYLVFYGIGDNEAVLSAMDLGNIELRLIHRSGGIEIYKVINK